MENVRDKKWEDEPQRRSYHLRCRIHLIPLLVVAFDSGDVVGYDDESEVVAAVGLTVVMTFQWLLQQLQRRNYLNHLRLLVMMMIQSWLHWMMRHHQMHNFRTESKDYVRLTCHTMST